MSAYERIDNAVEAADNAKSLARRDIKTPIELVGIVAGASVPGLLAAYVLPDFFIFGDIAQFVLGGVASAYVSYRGRSIMKTTAQVGYLAGNKLESIISGNSSNKLSS